MTKPKILGAGLSCSTIKGSRTNVRQPQGGDKLQGLVPTATPFFKARHTGSRYYSRTNGNRNLVFCMNRIGGIGAVGSGNRSRTFSTTADDARNCQPYEYKKKNIKLIPDNKPEIESEPLPQEKPLIGVYGGGNLKLDQGEDIDMYGTVEKYSIDIERTLQNLVDRNMKLLTVSVNVNSGTYGDGPTKGITWIRLIKILTRIRDSSDTDPIRKIQVIIGLASRHLLRKNIGTENRWGINGLESSDEATTLWKNAINEIGDLKNGVGDYSSVGPFNCLIGIKWDDFSPDYAQHNVNTENIAHTKNQIKELYDLATLRNLFIGGITYFSKFNRIYAKDGIELGSSGPTIGDTDAGTIDSTGLIATYLIPNENFDITKTYNIKFLYYNLSAYNWKTVDEIPRLRIICKFNDKEVLSEPVKYSQGREYDSPKIFPDMYEVIEDDCTGDDKKNQDCCQVSFKSTIPNSIINYDNGRSQQKLEFILKTNTEEGAPNNNKTVDGDTIFNVWDITISDNTGKKIKFINDDGTDVITPSFNKTANLENKLIIGRTIKYNLSEFLTPFITLPKWCRHIYNYRIENIYKNIVKNCDLPYYAVVRARAWNFDFSSEKIILQLQKAQEAGAKALLLYQDPTFVNEIQLNSDGSKNYRGIFHYKTSEHPRFDQVLFWTPYQGIIEGFYKEITTKETFDSGTEFRLNFLLKGDAIEYGEEDGGAFNFVITDENNNNIEVKYIVPGEGIEQTITNGTINSYVPVTDGLSVPSKEWGETVFGEPDYKSHIKNTHLTFKLPEGSKKIRFRLKIREGPMTISSAKLLAAYIRLHVKNGDTWNIRTDVKYDYDAGYNEKYKTIYEEVTNHILTI